MSHTQLCTLWHVFTHWQQQVFRQTEQCRLSQIRECRHVFAINWQQWCRMTSRKVRKLMIIRWEPLKCKCQVVLLEICRSCWWSVTYISILQPFPLNMSGRKTIAHAKHIHQSKCMVAATNHSISLITACEFAGHQSKLSWHSSLEPHSGLIQITGVQSCWACAWMIACK